MPVHIERRGGPDRGQGRKPLSEGEPTVTVSIKMTVTQKAKLAKLGGPAWIRQMINAAKPPKEKPAAKTPVKEPATGAR
jgi:hypothetical protein